MGTALQKTVRRKGSEGKCVRNKEGREHQRVRLCERESAGGGERGQGEEKEAAVAALHHHCTATTAERKGSILIPLCLCHTHTLSRHTAGCLSASQEALQSRDPDDIIHHLRIFSCLCSSVSRTPSARAGVCVCSSFLTDRG